MKMTTVLHHEIIFYFTFAWPLLFLFSLLTAPSHARSKRSILFLFLTGPLGTLYCLLKPFLYPEKKHFKAAASSNPNTKALPFLLTLTFVLLFASGAVIFFHKGWTEFYYLLIKGHSYLGYVSFFLFVVYICLHLLKHADKIAALLSVFVLFLLFALVFTLNQINAKYLLSFLLIFLIVLLIRFVERRVKEPQTAAFDEPRLHKEEVSRSGFGLFFVMVMTYYTGAYLAEPVNSRFTNSMALYILYIHGSIACILIPLMFSFIQIHRARALPKWFPLARKLCVPAYALVIVIFYPYAHHKWSGDNIEWRPIKTLHPTDPSFKAASLKSFVPPNYHWTLDEFSVCASSRCHASLVEQWETSTHRFSADNIIFKKVVELTAKERGKDTIRNCQNCHDPVGAFMADRNAATDKSRWERSWGVTCKACHSIQKIGAKPGNGIYWLRYEIPYPVDFAGADWRKQWESFIRWDLRLHFKNYSNPPLYQSPEYCVSCHRVTSVVHGEEVVIHDVYDAWKKSSYAKRNIKCKSCHMGEFERNPRGILFPDHRFPAFNQALSLLVDNPSANKAGIAKFEKFTVDRIKGRIAKKAPFGMDYLTGTILSLEIKTPSKAERGRALPVVLKTKNKRVGHDFPIGFKDLVECWLDVKVVDKKNKVVFHSGYLKKDRTVDPKAHIIGAERVWREGQPMHLHKTGTTKRRLIPPNGLVEDSFFADIPKDVLSPLTIYASWNYRRLRQEYVVWFFKDKNVTFPVTKIVSAKKKVPIF